MNDATVKDVMAITEARSLLTILLATCEQTLLALDAAGNVLETDLAEDLRLMIARTRGELDAVTDKIAALHP